MVKSDNLMLIKRVLLDIKILEMESKLDNVEVEHTFSEKFESIIRDIKSKISNKKINSYKLHKKTISLIAAVVIILSLVFAVTVAGDEIYNFFIEISEKGTHFFTPQNTENPQVIENSYCPSYIPQGYYTDDSFVDRHMLSYTFKNDDSQIVFSQMVDNNIGHSINTEHEEYQIISILDCEVFYVFVENQNAYDFVWHNNGYLFTLTCINFIDFEEAVKIIESVEEK